MTGVNATGDVDACRAKEIGQNIMDSMTGIPVAQYTFKRTDQVTTLNSVEVFSARCWTADTRRPRAPVPTPHCRIQCH